MFFQQPVADPFLAQSKYAKVDARIAFGRADKRWQVAIVGKNLTDKRTAAFTQLVAASGSFQALAERPRTVGFQLLLQY